MNTAATADRREREPTSICWFFHNWDKWVEYEWQGTVTIQGALDPISGIPYAAELVGKPQEVVEYRQKRHCRRCGFTQDRRVR